MNAKLPDGAIPIIVKGYHDHAAESAEAQRMTVEDVIGEPDELTT